MQDVVFFSRLADHPAYNLAMSAPKIALSVCISIAILTVGTNMAAQNSSRKPTADQILHNSDLWGKDFSFALSQISSWHAIGEDQVEILSNRVVGRRSYSKPESERVVSRLDKELHAHQADALEAVDGWLHNGSVRKEGEFRDMIYSEKVLESPTGTPESGIVVEVTHAEGLEFLNPRLTEDDLKRELGSADKVFYKKPDMADTSKYEGRPEIIKVYSYADGAVQFEVSNLSPYIPGKDGRLVEKAVIDTKNVAGVLPEAAK